jgi:DNA processing protein
LDLDRSARDEVLAWLRLTLVPGVPVKTLRALLAEFERPERVLAASRSRISAMAPSAAQALERGPDGALVDATLRWLEEPGHHLVGLGNNAYPKALLDLEDPPPVIYASGRLELLNAPSFAIVGSRNATVEGGRDAQAFASALSDAGLCIVSGLAAGIDAAAHRGGLSGRSSSIAVMGTGPEQIYPPANRKLGDALSRKGCLISEFAFGTPPLAENFPRRNRLISGLARGVLVVEAAALRSGSLITAKTALEQGRDVFAIPGSIHSPLSKGCHALIKEGAKLVECAQDILSELGWQGFKAPSPSEVSLVEENPVLAAMGYAPISMDEIAERTGMRASTLAAGLSRLEIEGRIAALAGGLFQRVNNPVIE